MLLESARTARKMATPRSPAAAPSVWHIGRHKVILGDCLDQLGRLPAASVDVIITSPPYNIGVQYRSYEDRRPRDQYLSWLHEAGARLHRVLKEDGSFFLNVGSTNTDPWISLDVAGAFRDLFILQNHITWAKSLSIGEDSVGHFKPISSRRFLNQNHESVFHFTKSGFVEVDRLAIGVPFKDKSNISRWGHKSDLRCAGNVWFIPYKTVKSRAQKFDHPAGFPTELPARCLKLHGTKEAVVLDPFLGAGTTLIAAHQLGHAGIGIEIDRGYAETAVARLQSEMG